MIHEEKPSLEETLEHHGIKGMHWGVRKSSAQLARERKDNTKYRKSTYDATKRSKEGPIKLHYSKDEILTARRVQQGRREVIKALDKKYGKDPKTKKYIFSKEHEEAYNKLLNSRERIVAQHKTRGEKITATLLFGPIGAYKTSDFSALKRASNKRA